jgi:hypothetical protein
MATQGFDLEIIRTGARRTALKICHPERSLIVREANDQAESKDP